MPVAMLQIHKDLGMCQMIPVSFTAGHVMTRSYDGVVPDALDLDIAMQYTYMNIHHVHVGVREHIQVAICIYGSVSLTSVRQMAQLYQSFF